MSGISYKRSTSSATPSESCRNISLKLCIPLRSATFFKVASVKYYCKNVLIFLSIETDQYILVCIGATPSKNLNELRYDFQFCWAGSYLSYRSVFWYSTILSQENSDCLESRSKRYLRNSSPLSAYTNLSLL